MSRPLGARVARAWNELIGRGRDARASYRGADVSRLLSDFVTSCIPSDDELRGDLRVMRARARDLARNDALVKQFRNLLTANVIGPRGPRLQPLVRDRAGNLDERVNDYLKERWDQWSRGPVSADRKFNLVQFEHLQIGSAAVDGEAFTRFREGAARRFGLALAPVDPDIVDERYMSRRDSTGGREVRLGIEIDDDGAPQGYWVRDPRRYLPGETLRPEYRIDAREVLHHMVAERAYQMRGVTWLAAVMLLIQHLERYAEAELVAARAGAAAMVFIVQTDPGAAGDDGSDSTPRELPLSPGTGVRLNPGEDVRDFAPNHPTTAFGDFTKGITRRIATGLALSYNALANDLENVNYSSIRSNLLIERDVWRMLQEWWIAGFRQPVYERWLQTGILSGDLQLPTSDWRAYTAVRWIPRGWPWVDPLKDAQAAQLALQNGLTSRQRLLAERGEDYEEVLEELAAEARMAEEYGVQVGGAQVLTVPADNGADSGDPPPDEAASPAKRSGGLDRVVRALRARQRGAALLNGSGR